MYLSKKIFSSIITISLISTIMLNADDAVTKVKESSRVTQIEAGISANELVEKAYTYIANLKEYSFNATILNEDNLNSEMFIYLTHNYNVSVVRPNKIRMNVRGDVDNRDSYFNNGKVSMIDIDKNTYGQVDVSSDINNGLDDLIDNYDISLPLTQLLYSNMADEIKEDFAKGYYIGKVKVDGAMCYYVAFPSKKWDINLWIEDGDIPLIRRVIFLDKSSEGEPRSIISIKWNINKKIDSSLFDFKVPENATKAKVVTIEEAKKLIIKKDEETKDIK